MARELDKPLGILEIIPPRDKEVVFLGTVFFWGKYIGRQVFTDVVGSVSDFLSNHPRRQEFFGNLTDPDIRDICWELNKIFENQEVCAQCETWSYYDAESAEDFALLAASTMLWIRGRRIGMSWFSDIDSGRNREVIIKAILREKLSKDFAGILSSGGDTEVKHH